MCGAAAGRDATKCDHCGARLATIACPACFGMIFQGAKFCSHCGAAVERSAGADEARRLCPKCGVNLEAVQVGGTPLLECRQCEGLWVDATVLRRIYEDREQQTAVLGQASGGADEPPVPMERVRYVPCPVCRKLMNRVNFAKCSAVVVDVCKPHGTWFDKDELRRVIEFIRAGGFEKARELEIASLERERAALKAAQEAGKNYASAYDSRHNWTESALGHVADSVVGKFLGLD